jgi:hypothetical protein
MKVGRIVHGSAIKAMLDVPKIIGRQADRFDFEEEDAIWYMDSAIEGHCLMKKIRENMGDNWVFTERTKRPGAWSGVGTYEGTEIGMYMCLVETGELMTHKLELRVSFA